MAGRSREAYGLVVSLAVCVCVSCYETWCAAHTQAVDQVSASAVDVNQTSAICDYCKSPGVHGGHPPGDLTDPCPPFVRRLVFVFFFFQAEDGIRDVAVTGVQTCALPISFILKHPQYAPLRAFPSSNYEFCVTNPETYKLLFGMYDDLLEATKGSKYFVLSTDEPYYVGLASNSQCDEVTRAHTLGSVGRLLAEFITKAANYLHDRGRTVSFWGEYPLKSEEITELPNHLVNREVYGPQIDFAYNRDSVRQLVYTSTQGEEPLFPQYYILPSTRRLHEIGRAHV